LTEQHDSQGYYLVVQGGPENYDLRYGPLPAGRFILADNNKFAAYVDNNGVVYVMNFRTDTPRAVKNLSKRDLQALAANSTPNYALSFEVGSSGTYTLIIEEQDFGDTVRVNILRSFSE
jgi:hypothetical protein